MAPGRIHATVIGGCPAHMEPCFPARVRLNERYASRLGNLSPRVIDVQGNPLDRAARRPSCSPGPSHVPPPPAIPHARILRLEIVSGFYPHVVFDFADGLNTLVGDKGARPSTAIAITRYAIGCEGKWSADTSRVAQNLGGGTATATLPPGA